MNVNKKLSVLNEERRDLRTDLKMLRRNRLYMNERIQECLNGIRDVNRKIDILKIKEVAVDVGRGDEDEDRNDSEVFKDLVNVIGEAYVTVEVDGKEDRVVDLRTGKRSHPKELEEIEDEEK